MEERQRNHFTHPLPVPNGETGNGGRDVRGRFAPGNRANPNGRPPAKGVHELKAAFVNCWSENDMIELVGVLKQMVRAKNPRAIQIVLDRLFGPLQLSFTLGLAKETPDPDERYL
jgi:hypothetical protein